MTALHAIAQPKAGAPTVRLFPAPVGRDARTTYVSADEVGRADAFALGYDAVCQHPNEVGPLGPGDVLVLDADAVLFGDHDALAAAGVAAAHRWAAVGVHTRDPDRLPAVLVAHPNVVVAKTHAELRAALQRLRVAS
ncbi:MAG: hypothetical protein K2V38_00325 [Gemmataceae bacterium]|nr:hypothetical protein [Gemmataceae bacterium]